MTSTFIITQNVDGLHAKALTAVWPPTRIKDSLLELHGTLHVGSLVLNNNTLFNNFAYAREYVANMVIRSTEKLSKAGCQTPTPIGKVS